MVIKLLASFMCAQALFTHAYFINDIESKEPKW